MSERTEPNGECEIGCTLPHFHWHNGRQVKGGVVLGTVPEGDAPEGTDWVHADRNRGAVQQQNSRGEWVPAIPLPLYVGFGMRKCQCDCGRIFRNGETYRGHCALAHILALS